jgi:hypothetical protein
MDKLQFESMWDKNTILLADIFDAIQANTFVTAKAANPKNQMQKPKPYPRPKHGKEEKARKPLPFKNTIVVKKGGEQDSR